MQAYEHIMTTMLKLAKNENYSLEDILSIMRKYGAYFTYPDSIRALVNVSAKSAFRQPSHMSEGAWMEFIIGDELKNAVNGYPMDKMYIPEGSELKAADGPTDINLAIEHNIDNLDKKEIQAILEHLRQDVITDKLFQGHIATCYIDENESDVNAGESYSLYGISTKAGLARFNQTGRIVPMSEFRGVVSLTQQLSTFELFKRLKERFPEITFDQIQKTIFASYDENYPEVMMNAKRYAVPVEEEQKRVLYALDSKDYSYYEEIKKKLIEKGAFKDISDIDKQITGLIDSSISIKSEQKENDDTDRI